MLRFTCIKQIPPQSLFKVKHLYGKMQSDNWITAKHNQMCLKGGKILCQKKKPPKKKEELMKT